MLTSIAWYKEENYQRLRELFTDDEKLPDTYAEWLKKSQELLAVLERDGQRVVKAYIDPDTFPSWCAERDLEMNAQARSRFASEVAARYPV